MGIFDKKKLTFTGTGFRTLFSQTSHPKISTSNIPKVRFYEGATLKKQIEWHTASPTQKITLRRTLIDSDKDGVPDKYDCQPFNPWKQDTASPEKIEEISKKMYNGRKLTELNSAEMLRVIKISEHVAELDRKHANSANAAKPKNRILPALLPENISDDKDESEYLAKFNMQKIGINTIDFGKKRPVPPRQIKPAPTRAPNNEIKSTISLSQPQISRKTSLENIVSQYREGGIQQQLPKAITPGMVHEAEKKTTDYVRLIDREEEEKRLRDYKRAYNISWADMYHLRRSKEFKEGKPRRMNMSDYLTSPPTEAEKKEILEAKGKIQEIKIKASHPPTPQGPSPLERYSELKKEVEAKNLTPAIPMESFIPKTVDDWEKMSPKEKDHYVQQKKKYEDRTRKQNFPSAKSSMNTVPFSNPTPKIQSFTPEPAEFWAVRMNAERNKGESMGAGALEGESLGSMDYEPKEKPEPKEKEKPEKPKKDKIDDGGYHEHYEYTPFFY